MNKLHFSDPISAVIQAYKDISGKDREVYIKYSTGMWNFFRWGKWGTTFFPDDESLPIVIQINVNLKIKHAIEIIAHELAHVIVGIDAGHSIEFEKTFCAIRDKAIEILVNNDEEWCNRFYDYTKREGRRL